jgi:hypothetical protein
VNPKIIRAAAVSNKASSVRETIHKVVLAAFVKKL